jgi:hypothetical protein
MKAERSRSGLVGMAPELRLVALRDATREPTAVGLGLVRLANELVPLLLIGGEDSLVAEEQHAAGSVQLVAGVHRELEIPRPAAHVSDEQHVVVTARRFEHLRPCRMMLEPLPSGVRDGPAESNVGKRKRRDGTVLLFALAVRPEVVLLTCRRFPRPACGAKAVEVRQRAWQGHGCSASDSRSPRRARTSSDRRSPRTRRIGLRRQGRVGTTEDHRMR